MVDGTAGPFSRLLGLDDALSEDGPWWPDQIDVDAIYGSWLFPGEGGSDYANPLYEAVLHFQASDDESEVVPLSIEYINASGLRTEVFENASEAAVVARQLFYNRSAFDGNDPAATVQDDAAIAPDKTALLPGQTASFASYSSYSRGINGIMVDVLGLPGTLTASDFLFKVGNNSNPSGWANAPAPTSITHRPLGGGLTRVTLIWADNAIQKQWLQVTVLATANTDLPANDVFYFGNAIGECGNAATNAQVTTTDEALTRNNQSGLSTVPITNWYDFNRDGRVNSQDIALTRNNRSGLTPLQLITPPAAPALRQPARSSTLLRTSDAPLAAAEPPATPSAWANTLLFPDALPAEGLLA